MNYIIRLIRECRSLLLIVYFITTTNHVNAQWVEVNVPAPGYISAITVSGTDLFVGTSLGAVFLSTDNGTNWREIDSGLTTPDYEDYISSIAISGNNLFAGTRGVFLSTNNGTNWNPVNSGLTIAQGLIKLAVSPARSEAASAKIFAGTFGAGVFLSTNNGTSWTVIDSLLTDTNVTASGFPETNVTALVVADTNLYSAIWGWGVFVSSNNGTTWKAVDTGLATTMVNTVAVSGSNIFTGTLFGGVFLSTNKKSGWVNAGLAGYNVYAFAFSGTKIFAGTGNGVFLSVDNGTSWTAVNTGLGNYTINALAVSPDSLGFIFAGTDGGIWRRPLSEMPTSVERHPNDLPTHCSLDQNFPNPFNPTTTISFSLPSKSFVSLRLFDALGRQVSDLLSEELPAGKYAKEWNATPFSSGIYFYRMQAGSFSETKKLLLLK